MRIAVDADGIGPPGTGVARYFWTTGREMLAAANDVEFVFYSRRPREILLPQGRWSCRTEKSGAWMPHVLWLQRRYPLMLAADRADVIWGQNYFVPVQLARRSRCVITLHDLTAVLFPQTMGRWNRLSSRLLLQRAVDAADVVLTVSRATARLAARLVPRAGPKLRVVYPGLGDGLARLGDDEAAAVVRSAYGLEPGYILSVGTIEPRKDYPTLLKAYDRLSDPPPLVIVGNVGWKSGRPMRQIRLRQATGHIRHIVGASDGVLSALYGAARLLVCPSIYEGFGSPVVEAMACGCPVLCSWTSSLPEVGGRAARYFRPRDVEDLRAKMAELLRNPQALDTMRAAGFEQARRFSYREAATKVLDVFWTLVGVMG